MFSSNDSPYEPTYVKYDTGVEPMWKGNDQWFQLVFHPNPSVLRVLSILRDLNGCLGSRDQTEGVACETKKQKRRRTSGSGAVVGQRSVGRKVG